MNALVPDVSRVAVLRVRALGDLVWSLPAFEALRCAYPSAEITLLGRESHRELLEGRTASVDNVVVVPAYEGVAEPDTTTTTTAGAPPDIGAFLADMRHRQFDIALQLHGGGENSNRLVTELGARVTAGSRAPNAPLLDRWVPHEQYYPEVVRCLEVAGLVGASYPSSLEPALDVLDVDRRHAGTLLDDIHRPFAVVHPGATDPRRRWPPERFAAVVHTLDTWGYDVVMTGSESEAETIDAVMCNAGGHVRSLAGLTSVGTLAAVLSLASIVIANDTGPLHLAAAVGTPTVGIYWIGNYLSYGSHALAHHRPLVSWQMQCPACGQEAMTQRCMHDVSFVSTVTVGEVLGAAKDLLTIVAPVAHQNLMPTASSR